MSLKVKTAGAVKWNLIDRLGSQVLYAVAGIVLARVLTQEEFGLVGAILVFQAFASLLIDSGFSYALIQRKNPTRLDYSSVLWFNLITACVLYVALWFLAPFVAWCFGGDPRLIPLSRVMFLCLIINASSIVQTNRLVKQMRMRPVAIANALGLAVGAGVGIWMALAGWGAWAIVWQNIVSASVRSLYLWIVCRWVPLMQCSWQSLRSFMGVGGNMMLTSFLNTLFLNIYSFLVGNRVGLVPLGYYTQADKWSKMATATLSQVFTSSFLPPLSAVQDDSERFRRMALRMDAAASWLALPVLVGLMVVATPVFHVLFGAKWDASIILFRLLLLRGIFSVYCSLWNNYLLSLGHARVIVRLELLRDVCAILAIVATFPLMAKSTPDQPVWGVAAMLCGQVAATVVTWIVTLIVTARYSGNNSGTILRGIIPYMALSALMAAVVAATIWVVNALWGTGFWAEFAAMMIGVVVGAALWLGVNSLKRNKIQRDVLAYLAGRTESF